MFARKLLYCLIAFNCAAAYAGDPDPDPAAEALAITPTNTELAYSGGALQIKANYAWSRSIAGRDIVIGVLDTGVWGGHQELSGRVLAGYDFVHRKALAAGANSDDNLHGTHVSGIIAANAGSGYMTGVAPNAYILPVKVLDASGSGYLTDIASGLDYSRAQGARVVNMSLGWSGSAYLPVQQALQRSVSANQVVVVAAGNESAANPSWPARYASQSWANGQIIAVGAVDANNKLASFSNMAGDARNFYLVAPGVNILSTIPPNIAGLSGSTPWYAYLSGTSMATPYVSGAVALIESHWPQLKASQVASILFTTATDLGAPGIDAVYGRGLVNVEKAMQPVGTVVVPTASGSKPAGAAKMVPSKVVKGRIREAADAGAFRTIMVDSYNRDYQIDLGSAIAPEPSLALSQLFSSMDAKLRYGAVQTANGTQFAAAYSDEPGRPVVNSFSFRQQLAGGDEIAFGTANFASNFIGLSDTPFSGLGLAGQNPLDSQFLGLAQAQTFAGYGMALQEGWTLKTALLSGSNPGINAQLTDGFGMPLVEQNGSSLLATAELSHSFANGKFAIAAGQMQESDRLLGGVSSGALAVKGSVDTSYVTASTAYQVQKGTWLAANLSMGSTSASNLDGGMITGLSGTTSYGWTASLLRESAMRKNDRLSLSVSQPLSAASGAMLINKAVGVNLDGSYRYEAQNIDLANNARETDFEVDYLAPVSKTSTVSAAFTYRANPGNDAKADNEAMLGLRWQVLTY